MGKCCARPYSNQIARLSSASTFSRLLFVAVASFNCARKLLYAEPTLASQKCETHQTSEIMSTVKYTDIFQLNSQKRADSMNYVNTLCNESKSFIMLGQECNVAQGKPRCLSKRHKIISDTNPRAYICLLYTSPSPRDKRQSRMPSSA